MKSVISILFFLLIAFPLIIWGSVSANAQQKDSLLVVINGEISGRENLDEISDQIDRIHYLSAREAANLYGAAGAGGALLVKTRKQEEEEPLVLIDGQKVPVDSLQERSFRKIDVIRGQQAMNIFGPTAKDGVWLVQTLDESQLLRVQLEVKNKKGKGLKGIQIKNKEGKLLGVTNHCGIAIVENLSVGNSVVLLDKKNKSFNIEIKEHINSIVLER